MNLKRPGWKSIEGKDVTCDSLNQLPTISIQSIQSGRKKVTRFPRDTVREFSKNMKEIDLLILDIVMPRKTGKDAYDEIRKIRPDVKAIFISGYTADVINQKGGQEDLNIVAKPVSPYELFIKIKETLKN